MSEEWDRFKFDIGAHNELTTVRHVVHVPFARRIVEDGQIMAGLVYDESRLNKSRISVAWLSANTWGLGSIYGTVEFQFAWADVVAGQRLYWVEAMTNYNTHAYRLLLSRRDIVGGLVTRYDPTKCEGPLQLRGGKYYWNTAYTSEFMVEEDLSLDRCNGLRFVTHHEQYCRPFGTACEDRQKQPTPQRTGGRMLAFILGVGLHSLDQHLTSGAQPFTELETAYSGLEANLPGVKFAGPLNSDQDCEDVVRGSLALYGMDQVDQARRLLVKLSSREHFRNALRAIIRTHFGNPNWEPAP